MDKELKAKFTVQQILPISLILIVAGIGIVYGIDLLGTMREDYATCSSGLTFNDTIDQCCNGSGCIENPLGTHEWNSSTNALTGVAKFPAKFPLLITVIIAAILIGLLLRYMIAVY